MPAITFKHKGNFSNTEKYFTKISDIVKSYSIFDKYGRRGVELLRDFTPKDTGKTADSWYYEIVNTSKGTSIEWHNSHINKGVNIAVILQYGHGTRQGGYVQGIDYINPAIQPLFEQMANEAWEEIEHA